MERFDQRTGFLVSAALHLTLLAMLITHPPKAALRSQDVSPVAPAERTARVFLPPAAVLRGLKPVPATPSPRADGKDRISVGPPSPVRQEGPMLLRREDDLTKVPKGQMSAAPTAAEARPDGESEPPLDVGNEPHDLARSRRREPPPTALQWPPAPSAEPQGLPRRGAITRSLPGAAAGVIQRMAEAGRLGLPTGTGQNVGGLHFDPQGADFTLWVNHFKNEVYRNWIVPQAALFGFRGHVAFTFTIERDGSLSSVALTRSSGTASLDRAAENALTSSRYLPLPEDYGPPRVTIQVTFFYNEGPQGS